MKLFDACKSLKNGKKLRKRDWNEDSYIYMKCGCLYNNEREEETIYIDSSDDIELDEWELYVPDEELVLKGKLYDIKKYCNYFKHELNNGCGNCNLLLKCPLKREIDFTDSNDIEKINSSYEVIKGENF